MNQDFATYQIEESRAVRQAMSRMDSLPAGPRVLFVTDGRGKTVGSLTDGDIRRALLSGAEMGDPAGTIMHRGFAALRPGDDHMARLGEWRARKITMVPVLDESDRMTGLLDLQQIKTLLPVDAVLMAGGRGQRLRPLTEHTPKPLLPIAGRPIIDYNIDALRRHGVKNISVTVNYLKDQLIDHFSQCDPQVRCVVETRRTGTFGSLSLIPKPENEHLLVMNSDLLTDIDLEAMYRRHTDTRADLTMAVIPYTVSVPYAIVETEGERVLALREKPTYNYFANAGVYLLKASLLSRIPAGAYVDAPDFIDALMADGLKVSWFPIEGMWIDIGSPEDYRRADTTMRQGGRGR